MFDLQKAIAMTPLEMRAAAAKVARDKKDLANSWLQAPNYPLTKGAREVARTTAIISEQIEAAIEAIPVPPEPPRSALADKLVHAATTASNDDISEPMSDKRKRHVERVDAMLEAADSLRGRITPPRPDGGEEGLVEALAEIVECVTAHSPSGASGDKAKLEAILAIAYRARKERAPINANAVYECERATRMAARNTGHGA